METWERVCQAQEEQCQGVACVKHSQEVVEGSEAHMATEEARGLAGQELGSHCKGCGYFW